MRGLVATLLLTSAACNARAPLQLKADSGFRRTGPSSDPTVLDGGIDFQTFDGAASVFETFGPLVESTPPPPPITGGNLVWTSDGVVVADQDRDRVVLVEPGPRYTQHTIALRGGDRPGRIALGAAGRAHVVLQGAGAIVTVDVPGAREIGRRDVCEAPRGIAYDAEAGALHVACASGELVTLDEAGGGARRSRWLEPDLRDVVVQRGTLWVSRFREAAVFEIPRGGAPVAHRLTAVGVDTPVGRMTFAPNTAWRMVAHPDGGVVVLHQRATTAPVQIDSAAAYAARDPCHSQLLHSALARIEHGQPPVSSGAIGMAVLAVDLAVSPDGQRALVAVPGGVGMSPTWIEMSIGTLGVARDPAPPAGGDPDAGFGGGPGDEGACAGWLRAAGQREFVGVAYDVQGGLMLYGREPALLVVDNVDLDLGGPSRAHLGHAMFHRNAGASVACASCHPEGGDDGRVWEFSGLGPRRTQSLRGGIGGTEPFHWDGDLRDLRALLGEVMARRMQGPTPTDAELAVFARWLDGIPRLPATKRDAALVERGRRIFEDPAVGCATCHNGARFTNNATVDVGTGGRFQVPSLLGIGHRAPYLHDGCAADLHERFGACGGGDAHGHTSQLSNAQVADLIAYLETL